MPDPTTSPLRLGIHGLGAVAQSVHLPLIARLPERFRIVAICDLSRSIRDGVGARWGVPPDARHETLDAMLAAGGLDGLVILIPGSHAPAAVAGLDAGLPVLCEKPLAYSLAEFDAVDAALTRNDGRLLLAYMKVYDPAVTEAHRVIEQGELGELRAAEVTVLHPTSESQLAFAHLLPGGRDVDPALIARLDAAASDIYEAALGPEAGPALGPLYADVLLGSIIHDLAVLRYLVGDPTSIDRAETWHEGADPPSVGVGGRFANGARLSVGWHYLPDYPAYREEVRLHFERGSVELVFPAPYRLHLPTRLTIRQGSHETVREHRFESVDEAFEQQLFAFERLARTGELPLAGTAEGRIDTRTCLRMAARLAERAGIPVGGEAVTALAS
jgi:myo-inositol 2-dehydrogenase/D-chiro-inositol 1-dehydrogenase